MTVTLVDYALLTEEEASTYLKVGSSAAEEDLVRTLINEATDYCEWWCNRPLAAREFENLRYPPQADCLLRVRAIPIDVEEDVTIEIAGVAQSIWLSEADGDPVLKDVIVGADVPGEPSHFWRASGWCAGSSSNPYPIRITYTGGFDPIPGQLARAAKLVVENLYRTQEKKLADIAALGQGPASPSISFRGDLIPMQAKQILDSYRWFS